MDGTISLFMPMLEFLSSHSARISHGNSWLIVDKDNDGKFYYTVYNKMPYAKRSKQLYEGHHLNDALWCLEHEERYK